MTITILKSYWWRRNDFIFNKIFLSPSRLIQSAKLDLEEYIFAQQAYPSTQVMIQNTRIITRWLHPSIGILTLNWDATLISSVYKMRIGLISRDHSDFVIACLSSSRSFNSKHVLVICFALQRALFFLWRTGMHWGLLRRWCPHCDPGTRQSRRLWSLFGLESKLMMQKNFLKHTPSWSNNFTYRESNRKLHMTWLGLD